MSLINNKIVKLYECALYYIILACKSEQIFLYLSIKINMITQRTEFKHFPNDVRVFLMAITLNID